MTRRAAALALAAVLLAGAGGAADLTLPAAARATFDTTRQMDRFAAPVGVWSGDRVPRVTLDGVVRTRAWRIPGEAPTPLALIAPLRAQLQEAGYRIVLDCAAQACGGYDFRFAVDVLPAPEMVVNLRSFHALTALKGTAGAPEEAVSIIASTRSGAGHIQITEAMQSTKITAQTISRVSMDGDLARLLERQGFAVLEELDFDTGTSALGKGPFASLAQLADTLRARPDMRVAVVGHTDTVGGLATNIDLSRDRARSVRQRLIDAYGIDPARLEAEGMGYLSPRATNATQAGRDANRRVEVIVLEP